MGERENKRYYWLKLMNNFFDKREIKKLRNVAGGETYTIIYLKLMLLSLGEQGNIFYEETENDIFEQIALEINEKYDDVKITLMFLQKNNLCNINSTQDISLQEVPLLIGSETQSTIRSRKSRALQSNTNATRLQHDCNIDIEKELELDIEIDKDKEINKEKRFVKPSIEEVVAYCKEQKNGIDGEAFWYFYESKGWKIGKNPMKKWKMAIATWEKNNSKNGKTEMEELKRIANERAMKMGRLI